MAAIVTLHLVSTHANGGFEYTAMVNITHAYGVLACHLPMANITEKGGGCVSDAP